MKKVMHYVLVAAIVAAPLLAGGCVVAPARAHHGAWVPAHWSATHGGVWVRGHWRR